MATLLKKTVVRKCDRPSQHNGKRLIVSLEPGDILAMREERKQLTYRGSLEKVYWVLAKWHALEEVKLKKEAKKQKQIIRNA